MTGEKYSALRPIGGTEKRGPKKVRHHLAKVLMAYLILADSSGW